MSGAILPFSELGATMSKKQDNYRVGYQKPPKHTRFVPGQSGHSGGRPKGTKNLKTDVSEEISEQIRISEGGQTLIVSKQRAIFKALVIKSLKGDIRATTLVFALIAKHVEPDLAIDLTKDIAPDKEIIADFLRRHVSDMGLGVSAQNNETQGKNGRA